MINSGQGAAGGSRDHHKFSARDNMPKGLPVARHAGLSLGAWQETIKAADEANEPGQFTAFIGYEWTSNDRGNNLHRNVIFRDERA